MGTCSLDQRSDTCSLDQRSDTCSLDPQNLKMKTILLFAVLVAADLAAPEARFSCSECVDEMHKLGWMVKMGAVPIHDYVSANYCPTLGEDQAWCEEALSRFYVGMLFAVVEHYFVDGAVHVCQTGGACEAAKEYTCDECIQGLEWVEAYISRSRRKIAGPGRPHRGCGCQPQLPAWKGTYRQQCPAVMTLLDPTMEPPHIREPPTPRVSMIWWGTLPDKHQCLPRSCRHLWPGGSR